MTDQEPINQKRNVFTVFAVPVLILISLALCFTASAAASVSNGGERYLANSVYASTLTVLIILSVILPFSAPIIYKGRRPDKPSLFARLFSIIPAGAAVFTSVYAVLYGFGVKWDLAMICFALVSAIFFILKLFEKHKAAKLLTVFGVLALAVSIIALLYFDYEIELNSTYKLAVQFGAAGLILTAISDARHETDRLSLGWYILLKSISLSLSLLASSLVITAFVSLETALPISYLVFSVLYAANSVSLTSELIAAYVHDIKSSRPSIKNTI